MNTIFRSIVLTIWQLPQIILSYFVILFTNAKKTSLVVNSQLTVTFYHSTRFNFGVSLKNIIIGSKSETYPINTVRHEYGHTKQSKYLGVFYLLIIGFPSLCGNIYDRLAHKNWTNAKRIKWYYSQPWEKWADELGGVYRGR